MIQTERPTAPPPVARTHLAIGASRVAWRAAARARTVLTAVLVAAALLWGAAVALLLYSVVALWAVGVTVGLLTVVALLWRGRHVRSLERVALWIEERAPALQYALVTAVDPRYVGERNPLRDAAADRAIDAVAVAPMLRRVAVRALGSALVGLALAVALAAMWPAGRLGVRHHRASRAAVELPNRLTPLSARVTPPVYARWPSRELAEPATISALIGSEIVLGGRHAGAGIHVRVGSDSVPVRSREDGWDVSFPMRATPVVVRLTDRRYERLVVLQPVVDAPPTVVLTTPVRDSTMREPATGALELTADATDDIGLASGYFEYLITSGEEESGGVTAREGQVGRVAFANTRTGAMQATLRLEALGLKGGDLLSVRAVVFDGNTVSGPGKGVSETRTLRIATKQEYDSLVVATAPPLGLDSSYMSQLMIVIATKTLIRREHTRHPPLTHDSLLDLSYRLANKEHILIDRIAVILHGNDIDGGMVIPDWERALLDTASQAMTDAATDLEVVQPDSALPPEIVALKALDKARNAKRLYLRGAPPVIVVNVQRVRMTGKDKPDAGPRMPGAPTDTLRAEEARVFASAVALLRAPRESPAWTAALDSLTLLRVTALPGGPTAPLGNVPLAGALNDAIEALHAGRDAVPALLRARQALEGTPTSSGTLPMWHGPS